MNRALHIRASRLFFLLGILMISASLLLALHNSRESEQAGRAAKAALGQLHEAMIAVPQFTPAAALPVQSAPEEALETDAPPAAVTINGYSYLGVLSVPSLGLELPVMENWSEANLKLSPCRYSGTPEDGDMVIAGHNYKTHFSPLKSLPAGAQILFTSVSGTEYVYSVDCMETLSPWQIEEMTSGDWDLTLFTCTASGKARLAIRCTLDV
jgi:sortase A